MDESNKVVLPGSLLEEEGFAICKEAIKQTEENIKKIDEIILKLQEQSNQVSQSINQGKMNRAILQGQKAISEEILKKFTELVQ